jgi:hypothetical protein
MTGSVESDTERYYREQEALSDRFEARKERIEFLLEDMQEVRAALIDTPRYLLDLLYYVQEGDIDTAKDILFGLAERIAMEEKDESAD